MPKEKSEIRNISYDILRIILCVFVIAIHTRPDEYLQKHEMINAVILPIIFLCNPLFFMISGRFNLCKTFKNAKDISEFYKDKIRKILIPWIVYSFLLYSWNIVTQHTYGGIRIFFVEFIKDFITNNISFHQWFMYALFGMIIGTPFISIMLENMTKQQQKYLFIISTFWMICVAVFPSFGIEFAGNSFFFSGWLYFYYAGWYLVKNLDITKVKYYYLIGMSGYVLTIIAMLYFNNYVHATDWAFPYMIFVFCFYKIAILKLNVSIKWMRNLIVTISKGTFSVYMIHVIIINVISQLNFIAHLGVWERYVITIGIVFVISTIIGLLVDKILGIIINCGR